jgi:hypothetical protein
LGSTRGACARLHKVGACARLHSAARPGRGGAGRRTPHGLPQLAALVVEVCDALLELELLRAARRAQAARAGEQRASWLAHDDARPHLARVGDGLDDLLQDPGSAHPRLRTAV